jgi:hypothetical protein
VRSRIDFSDPTRFTKTRALFGPAQPMPAPRWHDRALSLVAFAMMVAAGTFVALVILGAIGG